MRILGIDPGYATVGFGVVEYDGYKFTPVRYGAIKTSPNMEFCMRLKTVYDDTEELLRCYNPDFMSIEKLFFNTNHKTAIDVSQARGVILVAAANAGIPVYEYTPLQVKQSVVGYGRAEKLQVTEMVRQILSLNEIPRPDDAADALAIAICHGHSKRMNN
ncbi:MAG: crossover junction endodeoxyribonuclease RuvC [Oscillospiraceae bacterium]|nr:crossover junction endodeoxyribonuclease RuvC [Oscillospiraceae bacterium]